MPGWFYPAVMITTLFPCSHYPYFRVSCSTDNGRNFTEINEKINSAIIRKDNGLQKHPFIPNKVRTFCNGHEGGFLENLVCICPQSNFMNTWTFAMLCFDATVNYSYFNYNFTLQVYLVAYAEDVSHSDVYITSDGGESFTKAQLPFLLDGALMFYPNKTRSDWILALEAHTMVSGQYCIIRARHTQFSELVSAMHLPFVPTETVPQYRWWDCLEPDSGSCCCLQMVS